MKIRHDKEMTPDDINALYLSKGYSSYEGKLDQLYDAILASDYVITAWDDERLTGIIRSSGDMKFSQHISDLLVHPEYKSKGLASKLMNEFIHTVTDVEEIYLMMASNTKNKFTKNWLVYNGFEIIADTDQQTIYLKTQKEPD
ncbi:GNAT family N-acetyltransferase [Salinicoccus albus]|uniref:GNAT family N-acetyltransferase n=1 Tax=Salinicoccus albus TaxID=418756 RepID=UPI0003695E79|nr:GNAT family N-acetyltransferase [Salinicoccus albus]